MSEEGSEDLCYICYDEGSESKPFLESQVCKCKGSIKCHQICLELSKLTTKPSSKSSDICSICKTPYIKQTFLDSSKWNVTTKDCYKTITGIKILENIFVMHGDYFRLLDRYNFYNIIEKGRHYEGYKDGLWETFDNNGNLNSSMSYVKGKKHGKFVTYFFDSKEIKQMGEYIDDKLHGVYRWKIQVEKDIVGENLFDHGVPFGKHTELLSYGIFEGIKIYRGNYNNGIREGTWNLYESMYGSFPTLLLSANYKNGILNGPLKVYDSRGNIWKETNYLNGQKHGVRRLFNNRKVTEYINFKNGVLDGPFCIFTETDNKIVPYFRGQFRNGNHYGKHFLYSNETRMPRQIYNYNEKGNLDGPFYLYDGSGSLLLMHSFKNGVLHGKQIINNFEDSNNLNIEFMAKNGLASGKVKYMNHDNKIEELYVNQISIEELEEICDITFDIALPSHLDVRGNLIDNYLEFKTPQKCFCDQCIQENCYDEDYDSYYESRSVYSDGAYNRYDY